MIKLERKVDVNKHLISYIDEGQENAQAILFIHGFPFNKSMWDIQTDELKEHCRVISYDVRGHGNSGNGYSKYTIEMFAEDLIGLMDALKIQKAVVCGLSMGGYIALNAIARFPDRFQALVLCDTQCTPDTADAKKKRMDTISDIKERGVEQFLEASINNFFAPETFTGKKEVVAGIKKMMTNTNKDTLYKTIMALADRPDACESLTRIKIPVLIMVGNEDRITPPAASRFMESKIKDSYMATLVHAGHVSNMENPEEFNNQLKRFLEKVVPAKEKLLLV